MFYIPLVLKVSSWVSLTKVPEEHLALQGLWFVFFLTSTLLKLLELLEGATLARFCFTSSEMKYGVNYSHTHYKQL